MGRKKKSTSKKMGEFGWALMRLTLGPIVRKPKKGRGYVDRYRVSK